MMVFPTLCQSTSELPLCPLGASHQQEGKELVLGRMTRPQ